MANQLAENTNGYDKVSQLIGTTINDAFKDLFKKLTDSQEGGKTFADQNVTLTSDELANFLTVLGGASLNIAFTPRLVKGTQRLFDHLDVDRSVPIGKADEAGFGPRGSISIGIEVGW